MSDVNSNLCPRCKEPTIPGRGYCANCGTPLNNNSILIKALMDEALESRFKERQLVTVETSVDVAAKVTSWLKIFLYWAAIPLGVLAIILSVLGFLLGVFGLHSYRDFTAKVADATTQVQKASEAAIAKDKEVSAKLTDLETHIQSAEAQVSGLQSSSRQIGQQYARLQSDYGRYNQIDQKVGALQRQLAAVQGQVVNLGNKKLIAGSIETSGTDENGLAWPSGFALGNLGCGPSLLQHHKVAYCAQTFSLRPSIFFSQLTPDGAVFPISSVSPIGFQDVSIAPKPACTMDKRGTIYVEKGNRGVADKPYLCAMSPNGSPRWRELQLVP